MLCNYAIDMKQCLLPSRSIFLFYFLKHLSLLTVIIYFNNDIMQHTYVIVPTLYVSLYLTSISSDCTATGLLRSLYQYNNIQKFKI